MKKLVNVIAAGLLVCAGASAYANQVVLKNSVNHSAITVEYKLAYKNPGQPAIFSGSNAAQLGNVNINVPAKENFLKAGVVVTSVNGVKLPDRLTNFDQAHGCFASTDNIKTEASLQITYRDLPGHRHSITCESH